MGSKNPNLIGLYSPAPQMGKSTATNLLVAGLGFRRVKFAEPVKAVTGVFLSEMGVPTEDLPRYLDGDLKEVTLQAFGFEKLTSRKIQQVMGTEAGRKALDPNLWITIAGRKVRKLLDQGHRVVIDDMRFPNEYDLLRAMGGECWCILRPGMEDTTNGHPSEGLLDKHSFDRMVVNGGSLADFEAALLSAITRF